MTQSVEGRFDAGLDAAVRAEWAALDAAGLPSLARHTSPSNRPHVTFLAVPAVPPEAEERFAPVADRCPLPVRLGAAAVFARGRDRVILVRLVVPSAALLALHAEVLAAAAGLPGIGDHLLPGEWTPHVTLARSLPAGRLPEALATLGPLPDLTGSVTGVERWDGDAKRLRPVREPWPDG